MKILTNRQKCGFCSREHEAEDCTQKHIQCKFHGILTISIILKEDLTIQFLTKTNGKLTKVDKFFLEIKLIILCFNK